jgi:alginate O-acetyltransferase complex protein AlgJ
LGENITVKKNLETSDKTYPRIFSFIFFAVLLLQLLGPNLRANTVPDHFLWRMALIKKFNDFRYSVGDQIFNGGLVGKDRWLFYSGDFSIHDYQKTAPIGINRLKELGKVLSSLNESAAQYGGTLWVVIPPDKNTIYPQYMPDQIPVIGQTSRLDQVMEYLQKNTEVNLLDLRPIFVDASQSSQIYYKADAHWNCLGAYYASNEIISKISALDSKAQTHPLSDYQLGSTVDSSLDISAVMGLGLQEDTVTLTPKFPTGSISHAPYEKNDSMKIAVNSQTDLPSALVIHDSFYTECLNQFLEPQFSRVISSHYEKAMFSDYMGLIDSERPQVVIVEFAERHIEYFFTLMTRQSR